MPESRFGFASLADAMQLWLAHAAAGSLTPQLRLLLQSAFIQGATAALILDEHGADRESMVVEIESVGASLERGVPYGRAC